MLKICEISIVMHRGRNTMQKYLDLKGGAVSGRTRTKFIQTMHWEFAKL